MDTKIILLIFGFITFTCVSSNAPINHDVEKTRVAPRYRLPTTLVPTHYDFEIRPILDEGFGERFTAPGKVTIDVTCNADTDSITLHSITITIHEHLVKVLTEAGTEIPIGSHSYDTNAHFYTIHLNSTLTAGNKYKVHIEFTSLVAYPITYGLYRSSYLADNGEVRYLATTDFQPADARRMVPCFDEPQLKATWTMHIIRREGYHSLANMPIEQKNMPVVELPGWFRDTYKTSIIMSSYLVCLAVSDYDFKAAQDGIYDYPVQIWGPPPTMSRPGVDYAADLSAKLLTALQDYYGVVYAIEKMDKISIPGFASGAMENYGLNTYRETRLLYIEGVTTLADKVAMTNTISHELVHQWFGNYMTFAWWDHFWLSEGFATYYAPVGVREIGINGTGGQNFFPMERMVTDVVQRALHEDVLPTTHPVLYEALTEDGLQVRYSRIVYQKAGSLLRMMNIALTEDLFKQTLTRFLEKFAFGSAVQDDLFYELDAVLTETGNEHLLPVDTTAQDVWHTWTLQTGFPLITAARDFSSGVVTLSQAKFQLLWENPDPVDDAWYVPIYTALLGQEPTKQKWMMTSGSETVDGPTDPDTIFIINPEQIAYARVQYDVTSLDMIIAQLKSNHTVFDQQTRAALIDDNLNLAFAGYAEPGLSKAMDLTTYLKAERHLIPWTAFSTNMATTYNIMGRSANKQLLNRFIIDLMADALTEVGMIPEEDESVIDRTLLRTILYQWTCNADYEVCTADAEDKFIAWMGDPENTPIIPPDLQQTVYCTAIRKGGNAEWDFLLDQYTRTEREASRLVQLRALSCTKSSTKLVQLLSMALDSSSVINERDRTALVQYVAGNFIGVDLTFKYIRDNFNSISTGTFGSAMSTLSGYLKSPIDLTDLQAFRAEHADELEAISGTLDTAEWNINRNIKWVENFYDEMSDFLSEATY